ncbi:MAG TPA: DUF202 domain-containing protein [Cytophagales bacterium]|nr:DUF202 domain-containing protein [Cytophagales bacterium]
MENNANIGTPNDHLANERTFLAWVRTSIGVMAFGFALVKFSLFIAQLSFMFGKQKELGSQEFSSVMGTVLVIVGAITIAFSYYRYKRIEYRLNKGVYNNSSLLVTLFTAFILLVSIFLIVFVNAF